ncbi:MAG TPA: hypothetical protein VGM82_02085 [Gemmatimonadaceae bacterium]|jgi:hypothetical protein
MRKSAGFTIGPRQTLVALAAATLLVGCAQHDTTAPPTRSAPEDAARAMLASSTPLVGFPIDLALNAHSCRAKDYRDFDFWLGQWDARFTNNGVLGGTDSVASRLDGCAVEERWTDGGRGRSLNTFDQSLGQWTQFWVYSGGGAFTPLLLQGGFKNGVMRMRYDRTSETGVFQPFPPPGATLFAATDDYIWFAEPGGQSIIQRDSTAFNGRAESLSFEFRYNRVAAVTPIPVSPTSICQTRSQNHQFDFMLGRWKIYASPARLLSLGETRFGLDLGDCLMEEHVDAPGNYAGWSFNSWSLFTQQWHRTYVDNLGHRVALAGGLTNGDMILSGTQATLFGPMMIRVTWHPVSPSEVRQTWEASFTRGASWPLRYSFTLAKQ